MTEKPLSGHVALVTGASSGIGKATALACARAGATVVVNHLASDQQADEVVREIEVAGGRAAARAGDVSVEADVQAMMQWIVEHFGTLHVLVNNAGIQRDASFVDMQLKDWQKVIDVNLTGQFLCARAAAREFKRRGIDPKVSRAAGKIVCISSVHQAIPWARHVNYAASKGGVHMLMESLAQELAPERIRVNAVAPGAIRTPINRAAWDTPAAERDLEKLIPYGRIGGTEDVARAVLWLASDASDYVTGTTLVVDGGMMLYPGFRGHG
ncbi:MAG: glucose 1-dehydrogenase [Alphaproteobacteria bacterium]|nr:glucose 1-dehydrogenase [Alphaproteobacteria bacterium]